MALVAAILTLLGAAAISGGQAYSNLQRDLTEHQHYCDAHQGKEAEGEEEEKCKGVLYRAIADPAALATWGLVFFTALLFAVTAGLFFYAARQSSDAKVVSAAARDSAEAAKHAVGLERAWLGAPKIVVKAGDDNTVIWSYIFTNIGRNPITGLYIGARKSEGNFFDQVESIRAKASEIGVFKDQWRRRHCIVPQGEFVFDVDRAETICCASRDALNSVTGSHHVVGCVLYGSPMSSNVHQTTFLVQFDLSGREPSVRRVWTADVT